MDWTGTVYILGPTVVLDSCLTVRFTRLNWVPRVRFEPVSTVTGVSKDRSFPCGVPRTL